MPTELPDGHEIFAGFDAVVPLVEVSARAVEKTRQMLLAHVERKESALPAVPVTGFQPSTVAGPRLSRIWLLIGFGSAAALLLASLGVYVMSRRESNDSTGVAQNSLAPGSALDAAQGTREVFDMAAKAFPMIVALSAEAAPVIVANGGEYPVRLGSLTREHGGLLHVWNWSKGSLSRVLPKVEFWGQENVALSPDGKQLVWARGQILDMHSEKKSTINLGPAEIKIGASTYRRIGGMRFSPDGRLLALQVTNLDEEQPGRIKSEMVQIVDFPSGRRRCEFPAGEPYALRIAFSVDGKQIVAGTPERQIVRRDSGSGTVLSRYEPVLASQVMGVAIAPDGKHVAATQREPGDLYIWNAATGELRHRIDGEKLRKLGGHDPGYGTLRFSPDGKHLAAGYWGKLFIFDVTTGTFAAALRERTAADIHWSADGQTISVVTPVVVGARGPEGSSDYYPAVHVWDWQTAKLIRSLDAENR